MNRSDLKSYIIEVLKSKNGTASIIFVTKDIWDNYQSMIQAELKMINTCQYDIIWATQSLKREGLVELNNPK